MTTITTLLVYAVSLLAPISTAWAVYDALVKWLAFPPWVAATSAVALELVGLAAVLVTLTLRRYNATRRKSDPGAPMALAYVIIGGYVVVAELLTVLLDPTMTRWTLARGVFPLLSLVGFALAGLMDDHGARVATIKAEKDQARQDRKEARQVAKAPINTEEVAGKVPARLRQDWRNLPVEDKVLVKSMSPAEVVAAYCVKERTAREWVAKAKKNGFGEVK